MQGSTEETMSEVEDCTEVIVLMPSQNVKCHAESSICVNKTFIAYFCKYLGTIAILELCLDFFANDRNFVQYFQTSLHGFIARAAVLKASLCTEYRVFFQGYENS